MAKSRCIQFEVSRLVFGFTREDLKEDHALIELKLTLPINSRKDAQDYINRIKECL